MLHPIIGYGLRGCLWYQGESNYTQPARYLKLFPALVAGWRSLWGIGDFPFYYAQIAPYDYRLLHETKYINAAYIRDAQRRLEKNLPKVGLISLLYAGDSACIHPSWKAAAGQRFAMLALEDTYGVHTPGLRSPSLSKVSQDGKTLRLEFDPAPLGLSTFGVALTGFEVAGADENYYPASARIIRGVVEVSSSKVVQPVFVRYGFGDFVRGCLKGVNGLPVPSFCTDNWPSRMGD
jgi:sialate O-acetylesterase